MLRSSIEADSSELEDSSANVKHSPGKSEMTWTVDDQSSLEEVEEIVQQLWNQGSNENLLSFATNDHLARPSPAQENISSINEEDHDNVQIGVVWRKC